MLFTEYMHLAEADDLLPQAPASTDTPGNPSNSSFNVLYLVNLY